MRLRRAKLQAFQSLLVLLSLFTAQSALAATIHVPADQPTIQAGINAAAPGDTVLVAPGTYYENIDFKGKAITVTSSDGAAKTIIDGSAVGPVVSFIHQETRGSVLSNLTVRNGGAFNSANGNSAWGGVFTTYYSNPTILNNLILQNACNGYFGSGGALLQGNTISGTTFSPTSNCALSRGAGVFIYGGAAPYASVIGNTIENNVQPTPFNSGAILLDTAGSPIMENNIIRNNAMTGIRVYNTNALVFAQNLVYGNSSSDGAGGMDVLVPFTLPGPVTGVIANNTFVANIGISASYSASQVHLDGSLSQFDFVNNIVVGSGPNAAFLCGYPPADGLSITPLVIDHNDIYNASGPAYGTNCPDQTGTYGNLSIEPFFSNPATADFHLRSGSPAIDAGNTSVQGLLTKDPDGNQRLQDATSKGYPIVDMGVFEFQNLNDANASTIILTPSSYQVSGGASITLTAKLLSANGIPTGAVTFVEDNSTIGSSVIDPTGTATFSTVGLTPGIHGFIATYQGQSTFTPAVSVQIFVRVDVYVPAVTLTSTPNPSYQNQLVTFTAVVSPFASPILFMDGPSTLATVTPNSAGIAIFTTSTLTIGNHAITAKYPGDAYHSAASASITQQVLAPLINSTTTLTATPNPANTLQPVTLTASVSSSNSIIATGTVTFYDGSTTIGTAALDVTGHATFITSTLASGTHTLNAVYNGNTTFTSSTSNSVAETINANPTATTLSLTPNPAVAFQRFGPTIQVKSLTSVPFSASFCSPACTVTITITGLPPNIPSTITSQIPPNGILPITGDAFAAGTYTFSATFNGSSAFAASSAPSAQETITVAPTTLSLAASPNPATQTQTVTFTSTLTAPLSIEAPGGTITFFDGSTPFATAPFSANNLGNTITVTASTATLAAGTHTITANYPGNVNFLPVTSPPVTLTINPSDFTLTVAPSITIQAEHHATTPITLTSLGSLAGQVSLSCSELPIWTTCRFDPNVRQLTSGATATASLYLDTDAVIGYARNTPTTPKPGARSTITLALLLPTTLLFTLRRKLRIPTRLFLVALTTLAAALTISGCSGKYPPHTPPGAYNITITGTGPGGLIHTANITLNVTP